MRRLVSALALCLAMSLVASPGLAVTNGEPDGNAHPAVGLIVGTKGPDICSGFNQFLGSTGVLIAPDVLLTSAESSILWSNGLSQDVIDAVWVTFAADPISPDANVDCLTFVPVTNIFTNPAFNPNVFPRQGNVGVMILGTPQSMPPATLPAENELQNTPRGQDKLTMVAMGSLTGSTVVELERRSHMARTEPPLNDPEIHKVVLDPGGTPAQACVGFFESGGAAFVTGSNEILSVIPNQGCTTVSFNQRLDVPSVRNFLDDFVTLP